MAPNIIEDFDETGTHLEHLDEKSLIVNQSVVNKGNESMRFDESFASDIKTKKTNHNAASLVEPK